VNGGPTYFRTMMGPPGGAPAGGRRAGPRLPDGSDGPAGLVFESGDGVRQAGQLDRWLLIAWLRPPARGMSRMLWLLDTGTLRWSGGAPPAELRDGETGLQAGNASVLWFRSGVLGAAGIVDAARVPRISRRVRLRMSIDTALWGLSRDPVLPDGSTRACRLTMTASGAPRALEPQAIESWQ
jgi:hypothetical protein